MSVNSMTGYGVLSRNISDWEVTLQIKTVNSRFLDVHVRMSGIPVNLEQEMIKKIRSSLKRGRVDIYGEFHSLRAANSTINFEAAKSYIEQIVNLKGLIDISNNMTVGDLLALPGVLESAGEKIWDKVEFKNDFLSMVDDVMKEVVDMRKREGENLKNAILERLAVIESEMKEIEKVQSKNRDHYYRHLKERIFDLLKGQIKVDETRLVQEVVYIADRSDITEEIERFFSHIKQFREAIQAGSPVGKKLDFITQELNREINTTLSKTDILEISKMGLNIKAEIEKIREQVQNLE